MASTESTPRLPSTLGVVRFCFALLRPYPGLSAAIFIGMLFQFGIGLAITSPVWLILDYVIPNEDLDLLLLTVVLIGVTYLVGMIVSAGRSWAIAQAGSSAMRDLSRQMFAQQLQGSAHDSPDTDTGDVVARFTADFESLEQVFYKALPSLVQGWVVACGILVTLFTIEWRLGLATVLAVPFAGLGGAFINPRTARASLLHRETQAGIGAVVVETLAAERVVNVFGLEDTVEANYAEAADAHRVTGARLAFFSEFSKWTGELGVNLVAALVVVVAALLTVQGHMSLGEMGFCVGLLLVMGSYAARIVGGLASVAKGAGSVQRMTETLERSTSDWSGSRAAPSFASELRFGHVGFSYGAEQVLNEFECTIKSGTQVALVGRSGSGKSTVLRLLLGFEFPEHGAISWDDEDINQLSRSSYLSQIGVVFQEPVLFDASIRENIRMGRLEADDEAIVRAARAAELHEAVMAMPDGYETRVGSRGEKLSGGERQRVSLARALVREPKLLILDEATSALDAETEASITHTLGRLAENHTIVSVTHRLANVTNADQILMLEGGRLVEQGTHDELLALGGSYHRLHSNQSGFTAESVTPERLATIPLLGVLDEQLRFELSRLFLPKSYEPEEEVFEEGDEGDLFYLVTRGKLGVYRDEKRIATLEDGDYFGEMSLLEGKPRNATLRAEARTDCLLLHRTHFRGLLVEHPEVREQLEVEAERRRNGS